VNLLLLATAGLVVAGGIACVTARRASLVAAGVVAVLAASPLLQEPLPAPAVMLERAVAALLAAELLWLALRGRPVAGASPVGWPGLALLAVAAFAAGAGAHPLVEGVGPPEAFGTAGALFAVAVSGAAGRSDGPHLVLAALLLVVAASVFRGALSGPGPSLEVTIVALAGIALAWTASRLTGPGEPA
jgi:hypothetical protein